jgi:hypothetical protein
MGWLITVWLLCGVIAFLQRLYDDWCISRVLIVDRWDVLRYGGVFCAYLPLGATALAWVNWSR